MWVFVLVITLQFHFVINFLFEFLFPNNLCLPWFDCVLCNYVVRVNFFLGIASEGAKIMLLRRQAGQREFQLPAF